MTNGDLFSEAYRFYWLCCTSILMHTPHLNEHKSNIRSLDFSPDGRLLASGSLDGGVILWDVETGQPLETLLASNRLVLCVDFSPDGTQLATGSTDGTVIIWPVE